MTSKGESSVDEWLVVLYASSKAGTKCAILLRESTCTRIESWPVFVGGRSVMKSKLTWLQRRKGIINCWSRPAGFWLRDLEAQYSVQDSTEPVRRDTSYKLPANPRLQKQRAALGGWQRARSNRSGAKDPETGDGDGLGTGNECEEE
ncbi:hypothetical protein, conserved [Eimeria praecox]|uniref:Uncharacterized protein n=1 Tax=Eimeria praecox TaxID=51316 RepID=U6G275_9EIME|nr:hypothetical protein, conserved [Eimeria praecox]